MKKERRFERLEGDTFNVILNSPNVPFHESVRADIKWKKK
jgi:hypothetical protein